MGSKPGPAFASGLLVSTNCIPATHSFQIMCSGSMCKFCLVNHTTLHATMHGKAQHAPSKQTFVQCKPLANLPSTCCRWNLHLAQRPNSSLKKDQAAHGPYRAKLKLCIPSSQDQTCRMHVALVLKFYDNYNHPKLLEMFLLATVLRLQMNCREHELAYLLDP